MTVRVGMDVGEQGLEKVPQARIHTGFQCFMEIGQILQNVSGTQEVDFESPKYYLGEHTPDPSGSFRLWHLFQKLITIYPRSTSVPSGHPG